MPDISLQCRCGAVKGAAKNITPRNGNHLVCCCSDCQRFAHYLDENNEHHIVDEFGGTRIYQTSQSQVSISQGSEHVRCLRLTPKGLYRWYTECCNTPIGNTMNAKMAFVGLIHNFIVIPDNPKISLGPILGFVQTNDAVVQPDYPTSSEKVPLRLLLRIIRKLLVWKMRGMGQPSCFFDIQGKALVKPIIVNNK